MPNPTPTDPTVSTDTNRSTPVRSWGRALTRAAFVVGLLVVIALLLAGTSGTADARFPINNFTNVDDTATVTPSGKNVAVTGWVKCTEGEIVEVHVTVVQDSTEARGRTRARCLGEETVQTWTVHVTTRGRVAFDTDRPVRVDAWAVPHARGERTDDPHEWANDAVTLTRR